MRVKQVILRDFLNHESTSIDLSKATIHVFVGKNDAGKSSIRDAIAWALTGQCRGLRMQRDQSALIRHGASKAEVVLVVDDIEILRRKSFSTLTWQVKKREQIFKKPSDALGISDEILKLLMDASAFFMLDAQKQKEMLSKLLKLEITREDLLKSLKNCGIPDDIAQKFTDIALSAGFNHAQQEAITERRAIKKTLQNLSSYFVAPVESVEINGRQYRLAELSKRDVVNGLNMLKAEKEKLIEEKGKLEAMMDSDFKEKLKKRLESLQKQKALFETLQPVEKIKERLEDIRNQLHEKASQKQDIMAKLSSLRAEMARITATADTTPDTCPVFLNLGVEKTCPLGDELAKLQEKLIAKADELNAQIQELSLRAEKIDSELESLRRIEAELDVKIKAAEEKDKNLKDIDAKIAEATRQLAEVTQKSGSDAKTQIKQINQKITELNRRIGTGEKLLRAIEAFESAFKRHSDALAQKETLETQIEIYDRLATLFSPDGLIKDFIGSALKPLNERLEKTGNLFRTEIHFDPDLNMFVNNMSYNLLSESSRFRAGILIQEAIAYLSGARFFIIDRADILDPDNRALLLSLLYQVRQDYDTVLVFSTVSEVAVKPSPVPEIQMWWVEDGTAREIRQEISLHSVKKAA